MHPGAIYGSMIIIFDRQLFFPDKEADMKQFGKILALLAATSGLLVVTALLCRRRRRRKRASYITLFDYND